MTKLFLGLLVCFASTQARAAATTCAEFNDLVDGVLMSRSDRSGECMLSLGKDLPPKLIYRDFMFTDKGELMVFNSYGEAEGPDMTGARVFFFFPRTLIPDVDRSGADFVIHTATPQVVLHMNRQTAALTGIEAGSVKEDPKVIRTNNGGIEFKGLKTFWLDSGFALGHDPTADKDHSSTFHDSADKTCVVKNSEIFDYPGNDVNLKFGSDLELVKFLNYRCPQLTVQLEGI